MKFALESLLGADEWYRLKDTKSASAWRKSLLRAVRITRAAIDGTVEVADQDWREKTAELVTDAEDRLKSAKTIVDLFSVFSAFYMQLSFHQLGYMPNAKGVRKKPRAVPANWNLTSFRSVQYVQSEKQKRRLEWPRDERSIDLKLKDERYAELR